MVVHCACITLSVVWLFLSGTAAQEPAFTPVKVTTAEGVVEGMSGPVGRCVVGGSVDWLDLFV